VTQQFAPQSQSTRDKVLELIRRFDSSALEEVEEAVDEFRASMQYEAALHALRLESDTVTKAQVRRAIVRTYTQKYASQEARELVKFAAGALLGIGGAVLLDQVLKGLNDPSAATIPSLAIGLVLSVAGTALAIYGYWPRR